MKKELLKLWTEYLSWIRESPKQEQLQDWQIPSFEGFMAWIEMTQDMK